MKHFFRILGMLLCILPPGIAVLEQFPIWMAEGGETIFSAFTLFMLVLVSIPFWKQLKEALASPSAWMFWLIIFILLRLFSNIYQGVMIIAFVGFVSGVFGACSFRLSLHFAKKAELNKTQN